MSAPSPRHTRQRSRPTVAVWHHHLERAEFEEFTWRDHTGRVQFEGQRPTPAKRFRERVWPVFWRIRSVWQTTDAWELRATPIWAVAYDRSLDKAFRVKLARRWLVGRPLQSQWDWVDEERRRAGRGRELPSIVAGPDPVIPARTAVILYCSAIWCCIHPGSVARTARNLLTRLESDR